MKEKYTKPAFCVELFTLSQSIAQACGIPHRNDYGMGPTQGDINTCGFDTGVGIIWTTNACNKVITEDGYAEYCYNAPAGGTHVFGSY